MTTLVPSFYWKLFILAGNTDMQENLNVFETQPGSTTDYGVTCPKLSEKSMYNAVNTLALSF